MGDGASRDDQNRVSGYGLPAKTSSAPFPDRSIPSTPQIDAVLLNAAIYTLDLILRSRYLHVSIVDVISGLLLAILLALTPSAQAAPAVAELCSLIQLVPALAVPQQSRPEHVLALIGEVLNTGVSP
jgi:hypothetical protein